MKKTFAVAISCIDGRIQIPVIEWIKTNYSVDYVDLITEPAPNKILSENKQLELISSLRNRLKISTEKHNSRLLTLVAHADCVSNDSSNEIQMVQIKSAKSIVESWGFDLKIIGLWVDEAFEVREF